MSFAGCLPHAQCWSHSRRYFERALGAETVSADEALALIGALYRHEELIRNKSLAGEDKLSYRTKYREPVTKIILAMVRKSMSTDEFVAAESAHEGFKICHETSGKLASVIIGSGRCDRHKSFGTSTAPDPDVAAQLAIFAGRRLALNKPVFFKVYW